MLSINEVSVSKNEQTLSVTIDTETQCNVQSNEYNYQELVFAAQETINEDVAKEKNP